MTEAQLHLLERVMLAAERKGERLWALYIANLLSVVERAGGT